MFRLHLSGIGNMNRTVYIYFYKYFIKYRYNLYIINSNYNVNNYFIDFSYCSYSFRIIKIALLLKSNVILGTTGFNSIKIFKRVGKKIVIFHSNNFNLYYIYFIKVIGYIKYLFRRFDFEIIEKHHRTKEDIISGSSQYIVDLFNNIKVNYIRIGNIPGSHKLLFAYKYDSLSFSHTTLSKEIYCKNILNILVYLMHVFDNGFYKFIILSKNIGNICV